jgi:spermidine synthase
MTHRSALVLASALFALSGFTGLCYETVWFKRLGHVWGSSSLAMASVIAAFLLGLGLGARIFGGYADRSRRPLAWYGAFEILIGVWALILPGAIAWISERASPLSVSLGDQPLALGLARLALTFALIGPPCMLMGATLPILTRQLAGLGIGVGKSAAWLYAFNTLGAALGAYAAGFHLLDTFGLVWTNSLAAALNIAVGAVALAIAQRATLDLDPRRPDEVSAAPLLAPLSRVLAVSLATGCASITLQMLWARELSLLVGPTTYAFSSCLAVFILGVGLGSLLFRVRLERPGALERTLCAASLVVVLPALLGWALLPQLAQAMGHLRDVRVDANANAALCSAVSAVLEFVPTLGMGMMFPALVELTRASAARAGTAVGRVYAWNTIGSVAGAALTSMLLVPSLGSFWTFRAALGAYALAPTALFGARGPSLVTSVVCAIALLAQWRASDPLDTNLGAYIYGPQAVKLTREDFKPLYFAEGPSCNVLVLEGQPFATPFLSRPPERLINLRVHGKIDASSANDMPMQLGIAYLPRFLHPAAREVVVIGMGSGVTLGAAAVFESTNVTCCEIEPSIVEGARFFEQFNHGVLERDNVRVVLDDGRSYVQGHPGGWDLILSQPSNPWMAGVANLFTEDFYRTARARLARDGLFAQWIQAYSFTAQDFALVLRTLTRVFPHCVLLRVSDYDLILVAGDRPVTPTAETMAQAQALVDANATVKTDLERYFRTGDLRSLLFTHLLLDERGVQRYLSAVGGDGVNTDANMRLEFDAPRRLFHERGDPAVETNRLLYGSVDPLWQQGLFSGWRCDASHLPALKELKTRFLKQGASAAGGALVALGLAFDAEDPELVADHLLFGAELSPEEFETELERLVERAPLEAHRLGQSLLQLGQFNAAKVVYQRVVARHPGSPTAHKSLAMCWRGLDRKDEAERAEQRFRELDPLYDPLVDRAP